MKEQIKAIIQKEAERRNPVVDATGIEDMDMPQFLKDHTLNLNEWALKNQQQFISENQWIIDAIPAALQGEDRWVSVEEALPEEGQLVQCANNQEIYLDTFRYWRDTSMDYRGFWHHKEKYMLEEVTHWQPLPSPPTT